ncbi:MAG: DNA polymerase I [Burkholderiales bacterium]|nr:DNA polymerase I [Burkholderiales bacterium]
MKKTILLIDGSSFIFRAFYAIRDLKANDGTPTNAIYGVINMLKQMQKKYNTPYWVCVFDAKGKTFRDDIYPEYKANRRETPEELKSQIPLIQEIVAELGIPMIVQSGVEADDVIATIAKHYDHSDYQVLIATSDKDFAQTVTPNIKLVNTMTNEELDEIGVATKFGVKPEQIIDYLSLIGDTVDNVPGVVKCGPKTAVKWLAEFGSITELINNKDKLTGVVGDNFRQAIEWLPTAQKLITIDNHVKIDNFDINNLSDLTLKPESTAKLYEIYKKLNFRTWTKEAENKLSLINLKDNETDDLFNSNTIDDVKNNISLITKLSTTEEFNKKIDNIINNNIISTCWLVYNDYIDKSTNLSAICIETDQEKFWVNITNNNSNNELFIDNNDNSPHIIEKLKLYLISYNPKILVNSKDTYHSLNKYSITEFNNIIGDINIASYILHSSKKHELSAIITRETDTTAMIEEDAFGKGVKRINFSMLDNSQQTKYIETNSHILEAHGSIVNKMNDAEKKIYSEIELPLSNILFGLESAGIKIDVFKLKTIADKIHFQIKILEEKIHLIAGKPFNIASPKQLQDILFTELKLPTNNLKKITSGYSTDEETLNTLAEQNIEIANLLLEYRYLNKLANTYVDKLPEYADKDSLIHTSLEQTVVTSGRLSSKNPNLQNIPVRSEYGQLIRQCFVATDNHKMICADYSQIELRILAHISQDENLINAFNSGADIHLATASQIFAKPMSEITKDERRYAKTINFGLIYGKSTFGLAKELKIERSAAKLYIDNYFAQYPKVRDYMENIKKYAHDHGYVETIFGRKIYLPNINASNAIMRQAEERLALNAPMQGSAADIIKIAMTKIDIWLKEQKLQTKMILQVHDELIFNTPPNEVDIIMNNLSNLMSDGFNLAIKLDVDVKVADNWGDAH